MCAMSLSTANKEPVLVSTVYKYMYGKIIEHIEDYLFVLPIISVAVEVTYSVLS
jgi:hypothetical protein